jgi:hypothetical protein
VPLFVNTLFDDVTTKRFGEMQGSYPVLRIFDEHEKEIAKRIDGNPVRGAIPVEQILRQFQQALNA